MTKKGMTIVEIIVSMAIFMVVVTLVVGAFVTVVRMKALTSNMKESQQKARIAMELVTRLARQAEKVQITGTDTLDLYFNIDASNPQATRFEIAPRAAGTTDYTLDMYDCTNFSAAQCTKWGAATDLLGGVYNLDPTKSYFQRTLGGSINVIPPLLAVVFDGKITGLNGSGYYSDSFKINTEVMLEGIN